MALLEYTHDPQITIGYLKSSTCCCHGVVSSYLTRGTRQMLSKYHDGSQNQLIMPLTLHKGNNVGALLIKCGIYRLSARCIFPDHASDSPCCFLGRYEIGKSILHKDIFQQVLRQF